MHELSIALSMVERVIEEAETRAVKVEAVHLKLGVLSGVDAAALAFSYEIACEGTQLAGSRLIVNAIPLLIYCERCAAERSPESKWEIACPDCHSPSQRIIQGRELEVAALEIAA